MIGRTLSVVTLDNGTALSDNYVKVTLAMPREANRIEEIRIGGLTPDGLCEAGVADCAYISRRFSSDFEIVTSSENSMSLPTGMPIAMRVTFIPSGLSRRER